MKALLLMLPAAAVVVAVGCSSSNSPSSGDDSTPTGCVGLAACCATLSGEEVESCEQEIAGGASDSECQQALTGLQSTGVCKNLVTVGATGCAGLSACCNNLPVAENPTECMEVASNGTDQACNESLAAYAAEGYCGGGVVTIPFTGDTSPDFGPDGSSGPDDGSTDGPDDASEDASTEDDSSTCLVMGKEAPCVDP
jgi:hypothetical protein